jgi:hypothetical protein
MGEIQTHPSSSNALTVKQSLPLSALEEWQPREQLPETWTVAQLETTAASLKAQLSPCQPEALMVEIAKLMDFGRAFNLPIPNTATLIDNYRDKLGHLPADILQTACHETTSSWKWGNRMPMPADILEAANRHLTARKIIEGRAKLALLKLRTRTASISPISSSAAKQQAERMTKRTTESLRMDAPASDQMSEDKAFEQLSRDRAKFFEQYPEMAP